MGTVLFIDEILLLQETLNLCSEPVQIINEKGKSIFHNHSFKKIFGYSVERLNDAGAQFNTFYYPNVLKTIIENLADKDMWNGGIKVNSQSGNVHFVHLKVQKIKRNNTTVGFVFFYHDDPNISVLPKQREINYRKIEDAEKMARLGFFSSSICHELNNPLNILQSKLYFLKRCLLSESINDDSEIWEHIEKINQQIVRLSNLATSILRYARSNVTKKNLVNVNQILENTLGFFDDFLDGSITIKTRYESELFLIPADETGLEIVFKNLIMNAIDSIVDEGEIIISTINLNNKFIQISIKDNGSGIPEENIDKIFDPFFSNKGQKNGYGLGLSLCDYIIQEHDGVINLESKKDIGTIFIIHLPVI